MTPAYAVVNCDDQPTSAYTHRPRADSVAADYNAIGPKAPYRVEEVVILGKDEHRRLAALEETIKHWVREETLNRNAEVVQSEAVG